MARKATPPALLAVRQAVRAALGEGAAPVGGRVLVGCSGGADSLALAGALALEAPGLAGLVSVDHGLAPGSARRAAEIAALGGTLGLAPSLAVTVSVGHTGAGPEAAARDARLGALSAAAETYGAGRVWLAHTRDDQAEQVLLGLARGSGARSLAGMRPTRGLFHRPLLDLPRSVVRAACAELGLTPWEDPHNSDPRFARARVRHTVLPVLEEQLGPGVAAALARSARLLADDAAALDEQAERVLTEVDGAAEVSLLAALPRAVRTRVLKLMAEGAGASAVSSDQVDALDDLVTSWHGQGPVALGGGVAGFRRTGRIGFSRPTAH